MGAWGGNCVLVQSSKLPGWLTVSDNLRISNYPLKIWLPKLLFPTAHYLLNKFSAHKSLRGNFKMLFSPLKKIFLSDYRKDLENEIPNFPETCKFHLKIIIAICSKQCLPLILIKHDNLDK